MNQMSSSPGKRFYAGVGSRETPKDILTEMVSIGHYLADRNWHLRSGFANGADQAFLKGALEGVVGGVTLYSNYLPWVGFNGAPRQRQGFIVPSFTPEVMDIASRVHPNWAACSEAARKLHARNIHQVLGEDLVTPAEMVICWTPGGRAGGGTGQAIRLANLYSIPVFDLARESDWASLAEFVDR